MKNFLKINSKNGRRKSNILNFMDKKREYEKFEELLEKNPCYDKDGISPKNFRSKTLDLHGYKRHEALEKVLIILKSARKENLKELKIICGKGKHSESEPVLFESVRNLLKNNKIYYKNFNFDKNNNIFVYF
uniref:Smr domain-containing protein n=1 Tax=candidate division WOR-3 bacterium TaxID=2052148 RepID=A0A7C3J7D1_UNCW3